jgi:quercetin dioxygenase-like cupin family protein
LDKLLVYEDKLPVYLEVDVPIINSTDVTAYEIHGARFHAYVAPSRGSDQLCAWRLEVPPGLNGVAHRPNREEVLLVLDGEVCVTLDGVRSTLHRGNVAFVPANSELQIDSGPTGSSVWVTTTSGLEAVTSDGARITPPWAQ